LDAVACAELFEDVGNVGLDSGAAEHEGVGYLDDGTMIVVEGGQRFLDRELPITVTRVLQTVAGRMIFAQPRDPA